MIADVLRTKPIYASREVKYLGKAFNSLRRCMESNKRARWGDACVAHMCLPSKSNVIHFRSKGTYLVPRTYRDMPQRWWDAQWERQDNYKGFRIYRR